MSFFSTQPMFEKSNIETLVREDARVGKTLERFRAADPDRNGTSKVEYAIDRFGHVAFIDIVSERAHFYSSPPELLTVGDSSPYQPMGRCPSNVDLIAKLCRLIRYVLDVYVRLHFIKLYHDHVHTSCTSVPDQDPGRG